MVFDFSKIAEKNLSNPFNSGLIFWTGGLLAWLWYTELSSFFIWFSKLRPIEISLYAFIVLLTMRLSTILVQRLTLTVLHFLEGYFFPQWFYSFLLKKLEYNIKKKKKRFNELYGKKFEFGEKITQREAELFATLEFELSQIPDKNFRMPTQLGNILRFAENRPKEKYGLDSFICLPRIWLLLPSDVKEEISKARKNLDETVHIWTWSILFLVWTYFSIWTIPIAFFFAWLSYRWMLDAATIYSQLIESIFDVHRKLLYEALRWPLPLNPADEREQGKKLSVYLWQGSDDVQPKFLNNKIIEINWKKLG